MNWIFVLTLLFMLSAAGAKEEVKKTKAKSHHHAKPTKLRSKDTNKAHDIRAEKSVVSKKKTFHYIKPTAVYEDKDESNTDVDVDVDSVASNATIRKKWIVYSMGCKLPEEEHPVLPPKHYEYGWEFQSVRLDACVPSDGGSKSYKWEYKNEWEAVLRTYSDTNCNTANMTIHKDIPSSCEKDSFGQSMRYEYAEVPVNVAYYDKYEKAASSSPQVISYYDTSTACDGGPDEAYMVRASSTWTCVKNEDSPGTSNSYEQNLDGISVCKGYLNTECYYEDWRDVTCETHKNCKYSFINDEFGEYYASAEDTGHAAQLEILHSPDCWFLGFIPRC